jgi:carotenoid cleavage dioxygenase-like enzyme
MFYGPPYPSTEGIPMTSTDLVKSYVDGPLAPVTEERTAFDLAVTGTLPAELVGRYVRNGPNPIGPVDPATQHWFTGPGMVHGVRLAEGRAEWYRNRYVRTPNVSEALGEPPRPTPYDAEGVTGSVNTNVIQVADRTFALVEAGSPPVELSYDLDTIASVDFDGTLAGAFTAHPHRDPRTERWHAVTYYWPEEAVHYVVLGPDARVEHDETIDVGGRPMVHDTAITETRALLFDLPVTFDMEQAMLGTPFPYRWDPAGHCRVGVIPLGGTADQVAWCEVPTCYVFHTFNAVDLPDGRLAVDLVRWPRMFDRDRLGPNEGTSRIERWTLDPAAGTTAIDVIDERPVEFPRIDERLTGTPHRYGYGAGFAEPGAVHAPLRRYDFRDGHVDEVSLGDTTAVQEVVFVPRDGGTAEDDGWLVGLASDRATERTDLVVLDAGDPTAGPVARVHLPARVPDGFHGNWLPDDPAA